MPLFGRSKPKGDEPPAEGKRFSMKMPSLPKFGKSAAASHASPRGGFFGGAGDAKSPRKNYNRRASTRLTTQASIAAHDPDATRLALEAERRNAKALLELNEQVDGLRQEAHLLRQQYNQVGMEEIVKMDVIDIPKASKRSAIPASPKRSPKKSPIKTPKKEASVASSPKTPSSAADIVPDSEKSRVCIVYHPPSGVKAADAIKGPLSRVCNGKVRIMPPPPSSRAPTPARTKEDEDMARRDAVAMAIRGAKSAAVVIISAGCLDEGTYTRDALFQARRMGRPVVLLHDVASCPYPPLAEQPVEVRSIFEAPPTIFVHQYAEFDAETLADEIQGAKRLMNATSMQSTRSKKAFGASSSSKVSRASSGLSRESGGPPRLSAAKSKKLFEGGNKFLKDNGYAYRAYISYKRGDAEYPAKVLKNALEGYRTFLDILDKPKGEFDDGEFENDELNAIIPTVHTLLIYMSEGWLESDLCLGEFRTAVESNPRRRIVIVNDVSYNLPVDFSDNEQFQRMCAGMLGASTVAADILEKAWQQRITFEESHIPPLMKRLSHVLGLPDAVVEYMSKYCQTKDSANAASTARAMSKVPSLKPKLGAASPNTFGPEQVAARNRVFKMLSGDAGFESLIDEELNVSGHSCSKAEAENLIRVVGESTAMLKADFTWCDLTEENLISLFEGVNRNLHSRLVTLSVARNDMGKRAASALAHLLAPGHSVLRALNISEAHFGVSGCRDIFEHLMDQAALKHLVMMQVTNHTRKKRPEIAEGILKEAGVMLQENKGLLQLDLVDIGLHRNHRGGFKELSEALVVNTTLRTLDLSLNFGMGSGSNPLTAKDPCLRMIADGLRSSNALRKLYLVMNNIGDVGATNLAGALSENTKLTELDLKYNEIGSKGAVALGGMLKSNRTLKVLNLGFNHITFFGARGVAGGVFRNRTLKTLLMEGNPLGKWGVWVLTQAFELSGHLETLVNSPGGRPTPEEVEKKKDKYNVAAAEYRDWVTTVFSRRAIETPPVKMTAVARAREIESELDERTLEVMALKHEINGLLGIAGHRPRYENIMRRVRMEDDVEDEEEDGPASPGEPRPGPIHEPRPGPLESDRPAPIRTTPRKEEAKEEEKEEEEEEKVQPKTPKPQLKAAPSHLTWVEPKLDEIDLEDYGEEVESDILVVHHPVSGLHVAESIAATVTRAHARVAVGALPGAQEWGPDDLHVVEASVHGARMGIVVVITWGSLAEATCVMALRAALKYDKPVVLVHNPESCPFPEFKDQPKDLWDVFATYQPIPFMQGYVEWDAYQVFHAVQKAHRPSTALSPPKSVAAIREEAPMALSQCGLVVRCLLVSFRATGYHDAFRLRRALQDNYSVLLDLETQLDAHNLSVLASQVHTLVVYLSDGWFESESCVQQLKAAVDAKRRVVVVHKVTYSLPADFSVGPVFQEYGSEAAALALRSSWQRRIAFEESHILPCVEELESTIGVGDLVCECMAAEDRERPASNQAAARPADRRELLLTMMSGIKGFNKVSGRSLAWPRIGEFDGKVALGFSAALAKKSHFVKVDFTRANMDDDTALTLLERLDENATLEELHLENNHVAWDGSERLAAALSTHTCVLRVLRLDHNDLGDTGARELGEALAKNASLQDLGLMDNKIHAKGAARLAAALKSNESLTRLDLRRNPVGDDGVKSLCEGIRTAGDRAGLRLLELGDCEVSPNGARAVGEMLEVNKSLRWLSLRSNPRIGPAGGRALMEGLADNTALKQLDIIDCGLRLGTGPGVRNMLVSNSTIERIWMSENKVPDAGLMEIMMGLSKNTSVTMFDLEGSEAGEQTVKAVQAVLEANSTLRSINLRGVPLSEDDVVALATGLRVNRTICHLEFTPASSEPSPLEHAIKQVLEANRSLVHTAPEDVATRLENDPDCFEAIEGLQEQVKLANFRRTLTTKAPKSKESMKASPGRGGGGLGGMAALLGGGGGGGEIVPAHAGGA